MNFQALHFSSEEDSDDSSVDSYESSDEEGDMVGGAFSMSKKKDPETESTESFLKKLFYYSHMDGDNEVFSNEIKIDVNANADRITELRRQQKVNEQLVKFQHNVKEKEKGMEELPGKQEALQKQIDDLQQTKKFDIRILHYIDVLMQIKTCEAKTSSDKKLNKLNKDSLKWLYHEYITDEKERKIFYENVLFHNASFNESAVVNAKLFESMNEYYFLLFNCHDIRPRIDEEQGKYRKKIMGVMNIIKTIFEQLEKKKNKLSPSIKSKIKTIIDDKIGITYRKNSIQTRDAILSYIENIQKKIDPYDIQLKENSPTEDISRIQNQISNFLNDEYITNENNKRSNNPIHTMFTQNDLKKMESLDETIIDETIIQFWKDNQYENIPFDGNSNNYPFLIINQRKHTFPRFNIVFHKDTYAENVKKWFELCHTYEFTPISAENTMGLTEQYYNGLNVTFAYDYEEYYPFEIRFHTLETFMMKEIPHYHIDFLITQFKKKEGFEKILTNFTKIFADEKNEQTDNDNLYPINFGYYITKDNQDTDIINHDLRTILYFLIANQPGNLNVITEGKTKSDDFVEFEKIYKNEKQNNNSDDDTQLYNKILDTMLSNYLRFLQEKFKSSEVGNYFIVHLMEIYQEKYGEFSFNISEYIPEQSFFELPDQLQKICNDNMILKHFIANDSGIRFDIKNSKTPPEESFNPFPNSLGYELIVNDYMKFVMNHESMETKPLRRGEVGEAKGPETKQQDNEEEGEGEGEMKRNDDDEEQQSTAVESQDDKNKTPEKEYDVYFQHVNERVYELYKKLEATKDQGNNFKVTIASNDNTTCSLGTGHARTQWLAKGYRDEQYQAFITHLHESLKGLKNKYKNRVVYGRVSGSGASATNYHVWGANSKNWDLPPEKRIEGDGQAADMGTMGPGVFGIVTTPLFGKPELKNINNKDKIDKIIDELKELAKENNSSAESGSSQTIPAAEGPDIQPIQKTVPFQLMPENDDVEEKMIEFEKKMQITENDNAEIEAATMGTNTKNGYERISVNGNNETTTRSSSEKPNEIRLPSITKTTATPN